MKKILIFFFLVLLVGCGKTTMPTNEVQKLFKNYNNLSSDVLIQLDSVMAKENLNDELISMYKDALKRQYEDINYRINDEIISNDTAVVSTEIEVYNFKKVIEDSDSYLDTHKDEFYENDVLNTDKFWKYKIEKMKTTTNRKKYTIDFSLTKIDNEWNLDDLLESDRQKIHGLY